MRLLTHNLLKNNSADAKGKGFPLTITSVNKVRVDDNSDNSSLDVEQQESFVKGILPTLDWSTLVQGAKALGIPTLPSVLTEELAHDHAFLVALYHVLMNVHLVNGVLTCPATGREFVVADEIPDMILEEEECETVRY